MPITERGTDALAQKYDYEIKFVDGFVGRIVDAVGRAGLADDTAVVVLSDHGEAFGVHRVAGQAMYFHGQTLYDELLRVPLLVRAPALPARVVDQPAMLIDVAPTLLDLVGVAPAPSFRGRSLAPLLAGKSLEARPVFAELLPAPSWNHAWKMAVSADGTRKLVYRQSDNRFEYYDLAADGEERHDLWAERRDEAAALQQLLTSWIEGGL
jgi:arylsulfatase A-like enzyme